MGNRNGLPISRCDMTPYLLVKLVDWVGELHARKRLQKVVFLLQAAGCRPFDASFILHRFGPYSSEVSALTDQMVANGLLQEKAVPNGVGMQYSYELTESAKKSLEVLEREEKGA